MKQKLKRKLLLPSIAIFMMFMMMISSVYAWYLVWGDNFNDNSLAGCWTVLKDDPVVYVEEIEQCIKIIVPSSEDWCGGAIKLSNNHYIGDDTIVWVDITSWGGGNWAWGHWAWNGPRVAELVLSNEIYSPMSSHRRVAVKREVYANFRDQMQSVTFATVQIGEDIIFVNDGAFAMYNYPGPEQGYIMAFGIKHDISAPYVYTRYYVWSSYDNTTHNIGTYYNWAVGTDYPYCIFGAYSHNGYYGAIKFDDFNIYHD